MATIPAQIKKFRDLEKDKFSTVAQASWQKAIQLTNYINASIPVGLIIFVRLSQDNLPEAPDSKYWHPCDGSVISNANSPLNGQVSPNVVFTLIKHPNNSESPMTLGGEETKTFPHDHGGFTGFTFDNGAQNCDDGTDRAGPFVHQHTINSNSPSDNITPPHKKLRAYIRIV